MFPKTVNIISIIISFIILSGSVRIPEPKESSVFQSIKSRLNELNAELNQLAESPNLQHLKPYGRNCADATAGSKPSGIYEILIPSYGKNPFKVNCDATTMGGGWIVILNRIDGSENFYRNWNTYKMGFGDLDGEFFLGLDKIHALTAEHSQELLIVLEDFQGTIHNVTYERFGISGEDQQYGLNTLSKGIGSVGDSLASSRSMKFSTYDRDNDVSSDRNCAKERAFGAGWFRDCTDSNLMGIYNATTCDKGVTWDDFRDCDYSLKRAVMMIRPRK